MDQKLNFMKPVLDYVDQGDFFRKPVKWLYIIMGVVALLIPFYLLYQAIDNKVFSYMDAKGITVFIFTFIILLAAGVASFLLWWNRKNQITAVVPGDKYPTTPIFAHIIRTYGEWLGGYIGVAGFCTTLIGIIFYGGGTQMDIPMMPGMGSAWLALVMMPVIGFLIVISTRFFSEQVKALVDIARNTQK